MTKEVYKSHSIIDDIVERRRNHWLGGSGFLFGCTGSGKTLTTHLQIRSILNNSEDEVFVIDTDGDYVALAKELDGQVISLTPDGEFNINPFDFSAKKDEVDELLYTKTDFILYLIAVVRGLDGKSTLTPRQVSIVDSCVKKIYEPYLNSWNEETGKYDESKIPTLKTFYELLQTQSGFEAYVLAESFRPYVSDSWSIFSHPTNIRHKKRFVVYDLSRCRGNLTAMVVLNHIWNARNNGSWTQQKAFHAWIFIDDIYHLFKNYSAVEWFSSLHKCSRIAGCVFTGLSRFVLLLSNNDRLRFLIANSGYLHLLRMSQSELRRISSFLNLSPNQISFLTNASPCQGLILIDQDFLEITRNFSVMKSYKVAPEEPSEDNITKSFLSTFDKVIEHYDFVISDISSEIYNPKLEAAKGPVLVFLKELRSEWIRCKDQMKSNGGV